MNPEIDPLALLFVVVRTRVAQEYVSMAFSPDGKLLIAQGGAPEWNLVLWVWEKSKVACIVPSRQGGGASLLTPASKRPKQSARVSKV